MASFVVRASVDPLERERQEIERRRARFEDRRTRILDAKTRTIGVDKEALDRQLVLKAEREKVEKEQKNYFDQVALSHAQAIQVNRDLAAAREKERLAELAFYQRRQVAEKVERDNLSKTVVNPLSETSEVFLQFAGEDPSFRDRQKFQQSQQQQWIAQQLLIAAESESRSKAEAADFAEYQRRCAELHAAAQKEREIANKQSKKELADYNMTLKVQRDNRLRFAKQTDAEASEAELRATFASDFLNERTAAYNNANVHFKGFSTDARQAIVETQSRQLEEQKLMKEREVSEELAFADEQEAVRKELLRIDRQRAATEIQRKLALKSEQLIQHRDKQIRDEHLNKVVYKNPVSESYFAQFGTSHR